MKLDLYLRRIHILSSRLFGSNGLTDTRLLQSSILFVSLISSMGFSFIVGIITARTLGPEGYGDLKFITTVWSLLTLVSTFGFFHSGSRILAIEKESASIRAIIGTILLVAFITGISLSIITALIAIPLDSFFHTRVSNILILLAPLAFVMPIQTSLALILQGTNRIYLLSILNSLPALLYMITLGILSHFGLITTTNVLSSSLITVMPVILYIVVLLKPTFKSTKYYWELLREQNITYGRPVYFGSLANVATSYINRLAISYWVDNVSIGYYSLANSLTDPLKLIPNTVATSSFRSFAGQRKVSRKVLVATLGVALFILAASLFFFGKPLSWIYTDKFAPVGSMARVMAIGAIAHGFGDFYNRFLGAHGKGTVLRNVAYVVGGVNILGFFLLVPWWGAWGVVITAMLAGFTYFALMYFYYYKYTSAGTAKSESALQVDKTATTAEATLETHPEIRPIINNRVSNNTCGKKVIILLDAFGFPNGMASTQRVLLIAKTLVQNGFQVKVLCVRVQERQPFVINEQVKGVYEGIPFEYTPGTTIRSHSFFVRRYVDVKGMVIALTRLATCRIENEIDCIYYYGNIMQNSLNRWIFYLTARILGVPIVTDMSEPPWLLNHHPKWFPHFLSPLTGVHGVTLISEFLKDWAVADSVKRRATVPILQMPILVDVKEQSIDTKLFKADMIVLFAGSDRKTVSFIFQAMERVWQVYPGCRLIITGLKPNSSQDKWLEDLVHNSLAEGKVSLLGYLSRPELLQLYQSASVLLAPLFEDIRSRSRFPTKIAEYLCSGTPVITSGIGEVKKFLQDDDTAFISTPDDPEAFANKIIEVISPQNRSRSIRVGQNGRHIAATCFNIENYREQITTFFSSVCNKSYSMRRF